VATLTASLLTPAFFLSVVTCALSLVGIWLTGNRRIEGFYLGAANQVLWAATGYVTGAYGLILMSVVYFVVYVRGVRKWRREQVAV
jgi:hypothetical protein